MIAPLILIWSSGCSGQMAYQCPQRMMTSAEKKDKSHRDVCARSWKRLRGEAQENCILTLRDCTTVQHLGLIRFPNVLTQSAALDSEKCLLAVETKIAIEEEEESSE